jgi:hypothetical protein
MVGAEVEHTPGELLVLDVDDLAEGAGGRAGPAADVEVAAAGGRGEQLQDTGLVGRLERLLAQAVEQPDPGVGV